MVPQFYFIKNQKKRKQTNKRKKQSQLFRPALGSLTLAVDDVDEDVDDDDGARPADACAVGNIRLGSNCGGSLELAMQHSLSRSLLPLALFAMRFDVGEKSAAPPPHQQHH